MAGGCDGVVIGLLYTLRSPPQAHHHHLTPWLVTKKMLWFTYGNNYVPYLVGETGLFMVVNRGGMTLWLYGMYRGDLVWQVGVMGVVNRCEVCRSFCISFPPRSTPWLLTKKCCGLPWKQSCTTLFWWEKLIRLWLWRIILWDSRWFSCVCAYSVCTYSVALA